MWEESKDGLSMQKRKGYYCTVIAELMQIRPSKQGQQENPVQDQIVWSVRILGTSDQF